jgi:hypothetical protein
VFFKLEISIFPEKSGKVEERGSAEVFSSFSRQLTI